MWHLNEEDPIFCKINESNGKPTDDVHKIIPDYDVEYKFEDNHLKSRTTTLKKKNTAVYERLY